MSLTRTLLGIGIAGIGLGSALPAEAANQLFHASWSVKAFGNECAASKLGTTGGTAMLTRYPHCDLQRTGESSFYSAFRLPLGVQCNPNQPRCFFSSTPTDGAGRFAPLGGSWNYPRYCAPWYNFGGKGTTVRPAKGMTPRTPGKARRPIPPLYRNPLFFTSDGAPNHTACTATSTDGFGGKGPVQLGHPVTGHFVPATSTAAGGFQFAAADSGSGPGIRATGVAGEFGVASPYVYDYTYATLRNASGFFGPASGPGDAFIKLPREGTRQDAHIEIRQGANKFGGVMKMLGALTTKACYYRVGGCSLGENDRLYDRIGTTGHYTVSGVVTQGYQALGTAIYFNSGVGAFSSVMIVGSRFAWTTGSVTVTAKGRGPHKTVHYARGYDNRTTTPMGARNGTIQLVTPLLTQWLHPAIQYETGGIGILKLEFVPEPHSWMVLAAGISLLVVGYRARGR